MYVGASGSERTLLEIPHSALRIPHLHQAASRNVATSSAVPRLVTLAPGTMRRNSPASTFPGPTSMKRASAPASSAARCMQVTHRTGAVSWSASRRRARVASRTGSAVALAITGNAGSRNGARSSASRRWFAAGAMSDEWNAPLTLRGTTRLAPRARHAAPAFALRPHDGEHRRAVRQDRRLRVLGRGELVFGPFEHQPTEREAERLVDRVERLPRFRKPVGEVLGHPDFLCALSGAEPNRVLRGYHCTTRLAQVSPAPNAQNITFMPGWSRPPRTASSRAIATDAADVLP